MVVALALMAFAVMLALSLSSLLQVNLATTKHSDELSIARQNAYMGMLTAMGELQKATGPDARITARADIFLGPDGLGEDTLKQQYWLGVWNSKNSDGTVKTADDYAFWDELQPTEKIKLAQWIVSGNEGLNPGDHGYLTPLDDLTDDDSSVVLVGESADYNVPAVRALKVALPGDNMNGNYAYWVTGDNSKALVNVINTEVATSSDPELLNRSFQVPTRNGINQVSGLGDYSASDDSLQHLYDLALGYGKWLSDKSADPVSVGRARFHDLTTFSKGLLVDVKDGALKRDLTQAFEIDASFATHFPEQTFGTQALSDEAAADPTSAEPYFFVEDPIIVSGAPNWGVLRDYYQHYWPLSSSVAHMRDDTLSFRKAYENIPGGGGSTEPRFTPYWHNSFTHTDPYVSSGLPYQYIGENSKNKGDNYQFTSWITPIIAQIRISHSFELVTPSGGGTPVPVISFKPVVSLYNPYNTKMQANDFGFLATLSPKITLTLIFEDEVQIVEFYQSELHTSNKQGTLKISLDSFNIDPGTIVHQAFDGNPWAKIESNSGANADYLKNDWEAVGGLRFPLDEIDDQKPDGAPNNGAVSLEEARESGVKEPSWHPKWGISAQEKEWLKRALEEDAGITIKIEYDKFGGIRSYTNSSAAGQSYHNITDLWRPYSNDQPKTFTTSYSSIYDAVKQDSFETLAFSIRTTERMGGSASEMEVVRNLIDFNVRAIHSNSAWDGKSDWGATRYLSLFDVESLGSNEQEPASYTDPDTDVKYGFWGRSIEADEALKSVVLFERPRGPLLSLGQLQHANLGRYQFDPTYIVGTSYANVRIPMDQTRVTDFAGVNDLTYFDLPYLVNERIWDGFFFSTLNIPPQEARRDELLLELEETGASLSDHTLNPRMEFIGSELSPLERYNRIVVEDVEDENFEDAIYRPASEMWVNGAFNVNSTSVEAWKAILAGTQNLRFPVYDTSGTNSIVSESDVIVSRVSRPYNRGFKTTDANSEAEFWKGYRLLSDEEITDLAESIVEEVKKRGPFLSLASFINRSLSNDEFGKKGALQAALDNPLLGSDSALGVNQITSPDLAGELVEPFVSLRSFLSENLSETDRSNMGFPGYVLQSDLLQQIGSFLTVRSDTFTIRAYGDVVNPFTNEVTSRVWCEAKVQRVPTPVPTAASDPSSMEEMIRPSSALGRRYQIVSFKWLDPETI